MCQTLECQRSFPVGGDLTALRAPVHPVPSTAPAEQQGGQGSRLMVTDHGNGHHFVPHTGGPDGIYFENDRQSCVGGAEARVEPSAGRGHHRVRILTSPARSRLARRVRADAANRSLNYSVALTWRWRRAPSRWRRGSLPYPRSPPAGPRSGPDVVPRRCQFRRNLPEINRLLTQVGSTAAGKGRPPD
jgi:hypothetical protein